MLGTELFQLQLNLRMRLKCVYETDRHGVFLTFCVKKQSFWFYQFRTGLSINFVTDFVILYIYIYHKMLKRKLILIRQYKTCASLNRFHIFFKWTSRHQLIILRKRKKHIKKTTSLPCFIVQELCESRGGRPELSVLTSLLVSVDVKIYCTVLRHWSQLVPNMSHDIWGH